MAFAASATANSGSITDRRRAAAVVAGYGYEHFRKRIEPKIIRSLAWQLYQDSLQYRRRRYDGPIRCIRRYANRHR